MRPAAVLALAAAAGMPPCSRTPKALSVTVSATEHSTPRDGGVWEARVLAETTTSDLAAVRVVEGAITDAKKRGPLQRCTFLEGGEPGGLRFVLSDRSKIYVDAERDAGKAIGGEGCWDIDGHAAARLRVLARELGIEAPPR